MVSYHIKLLHWGPVSRPLKHLSLFSYNGQKQIKCCSSSYSSQRSQTKEREREIEGGGSYFVGRPWSFGVKPKPLRIWPALAGALADSMASSSWYTFCSRAEWSPSGLQTHTNQAFVITLLWCQIWCTFCSWMIFIWAKNTHTPSVCCCFFLWFQTWYTSCSCGERSPSGLKYTQIKRLLFFFCDFRPGTLFAAVLNDLCNITSHTHTFGCCFHFSVKQRVSVCQFMSLCSWLRVCTNFTQASYSHSHSSKWSNNTRLTDGYSWKPP